MIHEDIVSINYWSNAASETLPVTLTIDSNNTCQCSMPTTRDSLCTGAVGLFSSVCPQDYYLQLLSIISSADFLSITNPSSLVPGEIVRKISTHYKKNNEIVKFVGGFKAPPAAFINAEQILQKIIKETLQYPSYALSALPLQFPKKLDTSLEQKFFMVFINKGINPYKIGDPSYIDNQIISFELGAIRADIPIHKIGPNDQAFISLENTAIVDIKTIQRENGYITLAPHDSVLFEFATRFDSMQGIYNVWITCLTTLYSLDDKPLCSIELITENNTIDFLK